MQIKVDRFEIVLNESELWDIVFALVHQVENGMEHYAQHSGMENLEENNAQRLRMIEDMGKRLGRVDIYQNLMTESAKKIEEIQKKEKAKA